MTEDTSDLDIAPVNDDVLPDLLSLLDDIFGPGHDEEWFRWKHRSNPAGDSPGWVACDDEGVIGVRLFMRWDLTAGGEPVRAVRPVDTATAPRARRRGVFSRLTQASLARLDGSDTVDVVFNTPNQNSRKGYHRLGWTLLDPVRHRIRPSRPSLHPPKLIHGEAAAEAFGVTSPTSLLHTVRSPAFVRWRYDRRSGQEYEMLSLQHADGPNALVYRVTPRPLGRLMVVCDAVGSVPERRALISAAARVGRTLAWISADGPGSDQVRGGAGVNRGSSVVAVRPMRPLEPDPTQRDSWALTFGDLEDVI